jgi:hypothetical protein
MDWSEESRKEHAELLRWLIDEYESGRLTSDMQRQFGDGSTARQVVRQITDLANYAEDVRDEDHA